MAVHQPVLLQEAIAGLAIQAGGTYVDGTFGRGGHSRAILERLSENGRLIAIDKDQEAVAFAEAHFSHDKRFKMVQGSFAKIADITSQLNIFGKIQGILLDLGVSSPQLDDSKRGFSFLQQGPLDMRMDRAQSLDARRFVNHASLEEMETIFKTYGEERFSRRIATAIMNARAENPIETTTALAEIIKAAHPKWEKHKHPATRVFQAIRIHVNAELNDLVTGLQQSVSALAVEGRLVVISFHSLEDRIVKQFMQKEEQGAVLPIGVPVKAVDIKTHFKRVSRAIKPSAAEIQQNIRSRSAVLRIGEKTA